MLIRICRQFVRRLRPVAVAVQGLVQQLADVVALRARRVPLVLRVIPVQLQRPVVADAVVVAAALALPEQSRVVVVMPAMRLAAAAAVGEVVVAAVVLSRHLNLRSIPQRRPFRRASVCIRFTRLRALATATDSPVTRIVMHRTVGCPR